MSIYDKKLFKCDDLNLKYLKLNDFTINFSNDSRSLSNHNPLYSFTTPLHLININIPYYQFYNINLIKKILTEINNYFDQEINKDF